MPSMNILGLVLETESAGNMYGQLGATNFSETSYLDFCKI